MSKKILTVVSSLLIAGAAFAQTATPPVAPTVPVAPKPAVTAPVVPAAPAVAKPAAAPAAAVTPVGAKVNLNTAMEKDLDSLPQIGAARSKAIIEARAKGKFKNWDDFVARNVIPKNAEDAIKDKVRF